MKKIGILLLVVIVFCTLALCGCGKKNDDSNATKIVVNKVGTMATAKLLANSVEVEKEKLPLELQYIADLGADQGVKISLTSEVYTKTKASNEEFDNLHDYNFLFTDVNEEGTKTALVKVCKDGTPLRDYFFQADEIESKIKGTSVVLFSYRNKYVARFSMDYAKYDVETTDFSEAEMLAFVESLIK